MEIRCVYTEGNQNVIQEAVGSQRIFVLIRSGEMYKIVYTASPLEEIRVTPLCSSIPK